MPDNLTRTDLEEIIEKTISSKSNQKIDLFGKNLSGIDLTGLDLSFFNLENDQINLDGCLLDKNAINHLVIHGRTDLRKIIMQNQDLGFSYTCNKAIGIAFNQGFYLENIDLSNSIFINCNLDQATFKNCNLSNITFENCINIEKSRVINCNQRGSNINIPEYNEDEESSSNRLFLFMGNLIGLSFLRNILGDGS